MEEAESTKALRQEGGIFRDQRGDQGERREERKVRDDDRKLSHSKKEVYCSVVYFPNG